ncbi:helix-turn-helix domain-containing protein [Butyrivibrio sp. NC3005]|uniref:helix-turn-helix domain-containing protein n=1 Tax=Butyrivibrio sp. NC3005 TaxID=1280685 RepID=UPI000401FFEB|nr:helix-turn-helix transcriptional regulator [Butyrivibrio sp. NC3005]
MNVGQRIKYFRTLKGYSVNKLANLSGISQSYLRAIEIEKKNPTIQLLALLCEQLDISLKEFFEDDDENSFSSDPIFEKIYKLSPPQRKTLADFLDTIVKKEEDN